MFRIRYVLAALLVASVCVPTLASAQKGASAKHSMTAAKRHLLATCKKQANAQNVHFEARLDFMQKCVHQKNKS